MSWFRFAKARPKPLPSEIEGFRTVPETTFRMGARDLHREFGNCPRTPVTLSSYLLAEAPVIVGQYKRFVAAQSSLPPRAVQLVRPEQSPETMHAFRTVTEYAAWFAATQPTIIAETLRGAKLQIVPNPAALTAMPTPPSDFNYATDAFDAYPITHVNQSEAEAYATWYTGVLRTMTDRPTLRALLPSEAQWECAATCGGRYRWATPGGVEPTPQVARYGLGWDAGPGPVRAFAPNDWGFDGLLGNVRDWCRGRYEQKAYLAMRKARDPEGPSIGDLAPLRGASFYNAEINLRAAYRAHNNPGDRSCYIGFRLAVVA